MPQRSLIKTSLIDKIRENLPEAQIRLDEPMSKHSSFRIGGPADVVVTVCNEEELSKLLKLLHAEDARYMLIGNGSDLLFADEGYRGVIVKLGGDFEHIELLEEGDDVIRAGAARMLSSTANFARDNALAGLEFASGIPGTLGGALFMNAGAYGGEMNDVVESVTLMKSDGSSVYERQVRRWSSHIEIVYCSIMMISQFMQGSDCIGMIKKLSQRG